MFLEYLSFLTFLWIVLSFILTYFYLRSIEDCGCALGKKGEENYVDIQNLQRSQLIIIVIAVVDHFFLLNQKIDKLGLFKIVFLIAIAIVYMNFIYYAYHLFKNVSKECECADKWERYVLYKEFLLYSGVGVILIGTMIFGFEHKWLEYVYEAGFFRNIRYLVKSIFKKK